MKLFGQSLFILIAVLCFLYGTAVKGVGSGNRFWLIWWVGAAFFGLLAAALHFDLFSSLPRGIVYTFFSICAASVVILAVCVTLILSHMQDTTDEPLDTLVVLGAQVLPTGPSIILQHRLDTAVDYLLAHPETRCIVCGGQGDNEHAPEALVMRDYLISWGIDAGRIQTETESKNTIGNIRNSMTMFDPDTDTVGIVTNDFHLYRSVAIAKKQGIKNACGISAPSRVFFLPHNILRECAGIIKDKVAGNM